MDETGFRIGVGKDQLIVTKRKRAHYFGIPENRESATAIECISVNGFKGGLSNTTELLQTKRDLGRTRLAAKVQQQRRATKNTPLQTGGVLTVAERRNMVRVREESELEKAEKVIQLAKEKEHRATKRFFAEIAKEARKQRLSGKLKPVDVYDSERGFRTLKRF